MNKLNNNTQQNTKEFQWNDINNWTILNGVWKIKDEENKVYHSDAPDGLSRVVGGECWIDYSIEVKVKLNKWYVHKTELIDFGIIARYDDINNYYIFLYKVNQKSMVIEKKENGKLQVISQCEFDLKCDQWYTFKASLKSSLLEAYIDGQRITHATDASIKKGQAGLLVYFADVEFDDFKVISA